MIGGIIAILIGLLFWGFIGLVIFVVLGGIWNFITGGTGREKKKTQCPSPNAVELAERYIRTFDIQPATEAKLKELDRICEEMIALYRECWRKCDMASCKVLDDAALERPYYYRGGTKYPSKLIEDLLSEYKD